MLVKVKLLVKLVKPAAHLTVYCASTVYKTFYFPGGIHKLFIS